MQKEILLKPETNDKLRLMGEQIKLARLRRHISVNTLMQQVGISRTTLWQIEKGNPSVAIGYYAAVLYCVGNLDNDLLLVAKDSELDSSMKKNNTKVCKRVRDCN